MRRCKQATSVPLGVAECAAEVSRIADTLKPVTNPNMASDLTTGIALAGAAVAGALANVEINVGSMKSGFAEDDAFVEETRTRAEKLRR